MTDLFYYMQDKLFIPKKCKVGFNVRTDTYTGMLGYIIYHDGKAWRKLTSWEGWREKHLDTEEFEKKKKEEFERQIETQTKNHASYIEMYNKEKGTSGYYATYYKKYAEMTLAEYLKEVGLADYSKFTYRSPTKETNNPKLIPVEFDNVPTDGFVLNKKAGGYSSGWNHRSTYCRVWDPRGFEFEISIPNLLFILQETSSVKGKGLEGEFVYAWDGKDLVLLPAHCEEYRKSTAFTELQGGKVKSKELVDGHTYKAGDQNTYIYMGRFTTWSQIDDKSQTGKRRYQRGTVSKYSKEHIFYNESSKNFESVSGLTKFKEKVSDVVVTNFAELIDRLQKEDWMSKPKDIKLEAIQDSDFEKNKYGDYLQEPFYRKAGDIYEKCQILKREAFEKQTSYPWGQGKSLGVRYMFYVESRLSFKDGVLRIEKVEHNNKWTDVSFSKEDIKSLFYKLRIVLDNDKEIKY